MPGIFEFRHRVKPDEIDRLGHVSNLHYLRWTQDAALAHSAEQGWPASRYHEIGEGFVVRSHRIEYLRPAMPNDEIIVRTWVAGFRRVTSLRRFEIVRAADEKLLATAQTDWAYVSFRTGYPKRIPAEVFSAFEVVARETAPSQTGTLPK